MSDFMIKGDHHLPWRFEPQPLYRCMRDHHIDSLLVVDEQHHLRGVVTCRALFRAESPWLEQRRSWSLSATLPGMMTTLSTSSVWSKRQRSTPSRAGCL